MNADLRPIPWQLTDLPDVYEDNSDEIWLVWDRLINAIDSKTPEGRAMRLAEMEVL